MKRLLLSVFSIVLGISVFTACKDMNGGKLQSVSGTANELLVVMPKNLWDGAVGDTIRQFFGQEMAGLPQKEPIFDMINLPPANFEKNVRMHRSILMVSIKNDKDSASLNYYDSPWARTQKIFKITAPDEESFYRIFDANKIKMMGVYLKAERERLTDVYKKTADDRIFQRFKKKYDMLLYVPGGYAINKDTNNFVWFSAETSRNSRGVVFFEEPYTDESQFDYHVIVDRVNEELKKYIPGPLDSTWMALDLNIPMTAAQYEYDGKHYAMMIKGLWTVENDFMAGPFVLNVVLDQRNNRVIYMMAYVYAPDEEKRNKLRQVESIILSMKLDFQESETPDNR